jgi:hypothetical protein
MEQTGHDPDDRRISQPRKTWVEQYLGDGWVEDEPGIYRFVAKEGQTAATETKKDATTNRS